VLVAGHQRSTRTSTDSGTLWSAGSIGSSASGPWPRGMTSSLFATGGGNEHGRPFVSAPDADRVDCSVSHSGTYLLLAVVGHGRVGADVEEHRAVHTSAGLDRAVLTDVEQRTYREPPHAVGRAWFFRAWARKGPRSNKACLCRGVGSLSVMDGVVDAVVESLARWWEALGPHLTER
jgi:hypothetical protein